MTKELKYILTEFTDSEFDKEFDLSSILPKNAIEVVNAQVIGNRIVVFYTVPKTVKKPSNRIKHIIIE